MLLIIGIFALIVLKYFGINPFTYISWGWIIFLIIIAFIWFEFLERIFGFDKKQDQHEHDSLKSERLKNTFDKRS